MSKIIVEMSGDEAKLLQSLQRVIDKQGNMTKGIKKVGKSADDAAGKVNKGFGDGAVKKLATLATGYISLSVAIGTVKTALSSVITEADAAGDRLVQGELLYRQFRQTAGGSQSKFTRQRAFAEKLRLVGYTRRGAAALTFTGASADLDQYINDSKLKTFENLHKIDMSGKIAIDSAQIIQENFKNTRNGVGSVTKGAGSFEQISNKILYVSGGSPINAEKIAGAASIAATPAARIGLLDEDLLAITAVATKFSDKPASELEKQKSLFNKFAKKMEVGQLNLTGLGKMSTFDILAKLPELEQQGRLLSGPVGKKNSKPQKLMEWFGDALAVQGLDVIIKGEEEIRKLKKGAAKVETETGTKQDYLTNLAKPTSPELQIAETVEKKNAQAEKKLEDKYGSLSSLINAQLQERRIRDIESGTKPLVAWGKFAANQYWRYWTWLNNGDSDYASMFEPDSKELRENRRVLFDQKNIRGVAFSSEENRALKAMQAEAERLGPSDVERSRRRDPLNDFDREMFRINHPEYAKLGESFITTAIKATNQKPLPDFVYKYDQLSQSRLVPDVFLNLAERTKSASGMQKVVRKYEDSLYQEQRIVRPEERASPKWNGAPPLWYQSMQSREKMVDRLVEKLESIVGNMGKASGGLKDAADNMSKASANLDAATRDAQRRKLSANRNAHR